MPDPPAASLPVASVAIDVPLAHLDRPFDYLVTESQAAVAVPGARVRVRFAGQDRQGFVLTRTARSGFDGRLERISRVVSNEPVLSPEVARLARLVADRWAGTFADVLRLAVPARHARVEKEPPRPVAGRPEPPEPGPWRSYPAGAALVAALIRGDRPRAVWNALPGEDWPRALAVAVRATLAAGRGALVVVPDGRDVDRVERALAAEIGVGRHAALTAELGPAERYRRWLAVRRGSVRAVVGTRAAVYAPVHDLGLAVVWDDGDDLHAEPHAPYAHAREVLLLRAHEEGAAAIVAGTTRTAEGAQLLASGWARSVTALRADVRRAAPRVDVAGTGNERERDPAAVSARLPSLAWRTARRALEDGPVLVQVPRGGYVPAVACRGCRQVGRCAACGGPLGLTAANAAPVCRWCGRPAAHWRCPDCGASGLRGVRFGSRRTAEELGRAFPNVPVRTSGGNGILATVPAEPAVVVATPGAEPLADGGYAAALLLDGHVLLSRPDLRAGEEALRRWLTAATLVRPGRRGGAVVLVAEPGLPPVQALLRWDPGGHAERELRDRQGLGFPPAARVATLTGTRASVTELLAALALPAQSEVLGPTPVVECRDREELVRALVRVPRAAGVELAAALRVGQAARSARKADRVRVRIDPLDLA